MIPHTPFYFIRHGETEWNRQGTYMGKTDIALNTMGREQARQAAQLLKDEPITHIVTSPLLRAQETAEILAETLQAPVSIIEELQEVQFGVFEGKPANRDVFYRWLKGENIEGVKSITEAGEQLLEAMTQALALPGPVLIVSHGGVYHAIRRVLGWSSPGPVHNCAAFYHQPPEDPQQSWMMVELGENEER